MNLPEIFADLAIPASSPLFTAEMPDLLLKETSAFIDEVTWQGPGDFQTLLTAPFTFMNGPLAQFYGLSGVTGDDLRQVAVDPTRRAGILTQASLLAASSRATRESPTFRGKLIFERFLCRTFPAPAPDIPLPPPNPDSDPTKLTTRQLYQQEISGASCIGCHRDMDPLGFAFEHFDRFGLWRDTEDGLGIDTTGEIYKTDAAGNFDGAIELIFPSRPEPRRPELLRRKLDEVRVRPRAKQPRRLLGSAPTGV